MERLVHSYLFSDALEGHPCRLVDGCTHAPYEWFKVPPTKLIAAIEFWAEWIDQLSESNPDG